MWLVTYSTGVSASRWTFWLLALLLSGCDCGNPGKPDGGSDGGPDSGADGGADAGCLEHSPCARDAGAGVCFAGGCVECTLDLDCADRELCTRDRCANHSCIHELAHDGDAGFLSVPELSSELKLSSGPATPIAAVWTGANFLVAYQQAGIDITQLERISLDGGAADAFLLPSSLKLLAANDSQLLAVFETMADGVTAQLLSPTGASLSAFTLEGIVNNQPRAAGVAAGPDGFLVNWDYYNGRANTVALISNTGILTAGAYLKPGLLGESQRGRGAWNGSAFVLVWEDFQEHPANSSIWAAELSGQAVATPALGAPTLRSDLSGIHDYYAPELVGGGRLMLLANNDGQSIAISPLDATLTAGTPLLLAAPELLLGSARPLATHDGAQVLVIVSSAGVGSGAFHRVTRNAVNLDATAVVFAASTAGNQVRVGSSVLATDRAGHVLVSYQRNNADGGTTGAFARLVRTCP